MNSTRRFCARPAAVAVGAFSAIAVRATNSFSVNKEFFS
jgi:hypothetical protein